MALMRRRSWWLVTGSVLLSALATASPVSAQVRFWDVRLTSGIYHRNVQIVSTDGDQIFMKEAGRDVQAPLGQVTEIRSSPLGAAANTLDHSAPLTPVAPGTAATTPGGATAATASDAGATDSAAARQARMGGFILPDTTTVLYQFTSYDLVERKRIVTALAKGEKP
jgi:hypothetical protein